MYTCDRIFRLHWKIFLGVTVFVGIFSAVYEYHAHGVRSKPMIFAFLFPLVLGVIPLVALAYLGSMKKILYDGAARAGINLFYAGIATLTLGSISSGVVEIYGTTNHLIKYFYIVGCPLLAVGLVVASVGLAKKVNEAGRKNAEDAEAGEEEDVVIGDLQ